MYTQLIEVSGKTQDECVVALHDCNEDVNRAINFLLESTSDTVRAQTCKHQYTETKKKKIYRDKNKNYNSKSSGYFCVCVVENVCSIGLIIYSLYFVASMFIFTVQNSWETVGKKRSIGKEGGSSDLKESREKKGEREASRGRGASNRRGRGISRGREGGKC